MIPQHGAILIAEVSDTMRRTLDLGRRIEIHSMDKHCEDISISLYRQEATEGPRFLVHTYSNSDAAAARVGFIRQALAARLGMALAEADSNWLKFSCSGEHLRALRRAFLDLCRLETGASLEPMPLTAFDKKADCDLQAVNLGGGKYQMKSASGDQKGEKRAAALARGFAKLCEMREVEGSPCVVEFPCGAGHDPLVGQLMYRAQNVRSALKEEELSAGRGVLAPPSQQ